MPNQKNPPTHQPTSLKTLFFGTPRLAQIVLGKLINSPYKPQLIVTTSDKRVGRGQKLAPSPVKQTAVKNHIEVLQPKGSNDLRLTINDLRFDLAILVAYGKIIPKEILQIPKYGFINVHPSILPKYRGPSPIQTAILAGEEKTGVTIMLLDQKIDHGPILAQREVTIEKTDTHESLIENLGKIGSDLLIEVLPYYLAGDLQPKPQDHSKATYTKIIKKSDGFLNLKNPPDPQALDHIVRAFYPWPGVWTKLRTQNSKLITIKFLPGNLILPEGKKPMTIKEFLNGYPRARELIEKLVSTSR